MNYPVAANELTVVGFAIFIQHWLEQKHHMVVILIVSFTCQ